MNSILAKKLQIWGFEKDFAIFQDGSLGFAFEATPIDVSCWSADQINQLATKLDQFLNGLMPELNIQFIQEVTSGNDQVISKHLELGEKCINPLVRTLTTERAKRLQRLDKMGLLPTHKLKVLVRTKPKSSVSGKLKFLSSEASFAEMTEHELARTIQSVTRMKSEVLQSLSQLGMELRSLEVHEMIGEALFTVEPRPKY